MDDYEESDSEPPKEEIIPIEKNPAWKKFCRDYWGIEPDSEEFKKKCREIEEGLGLCQKDGQKKK